MKRIDNSDRGPLRRKSVCHRVEAPSKSSLNRMNAAGRWAGLLVIMGCAVVARGSEQSIGGPEINVGSKAFTESVLLGEIVSHLTADAGGQVRHRGNLGGTQVMWKALLNGDIDVYPDYTGTITQDIFADRELSGDAEIREALAEYGVRMSGPLGFNNTYALGMKQSASTSERAPIETISDLREHPDLKFGFSSEFIDRNDGWPGLRSAYGLPQKNVRGLNHDLAYRGLESGAIDVIDLYSTDAEIQYYQLKVLEDDLRHFPDYQAVLLYRDDLRERAPEVVQAMQRLEGAIAEEAMIAMNARVKLDKEPERLVAADFVRGRFGLGTDLEVETRVSRFVKRTREHFSLVAISVTAAILFAVPLGVFAAKRPLVGQFTLAAVGLLQTVPSLALFVILIPLLGLGPAPAICALFLYSLLPIVRNTYAGLHDIPRPVHESAEALGLPPAARLRLIELPMAARSILAGIKTAVVINVGTATLGGFIGAGGYGEPIFTGIRRDSTPLILEGAIPAALMALFAQGLFELVERRLVPKGLRIKAET